MLLFIFLCKLYDSLTTSSQQLIMATTGNLYSLLIQMDLSSSICGKNGKTSLHFQSVLNHVWLSNQGVWNDRAFVIFLSLLSSATSFPLICSPSVELSLVSFCKASAWEGLRVKAKKLSSVQKFSLDGPDISWKKSPLRVLRRHARVSMSHVHQSMVRAWNALGTILGRKAAILNLLSKYPELHETLLKWFWEMKNQDKSSILNQNFVV